MSTSAGLPDFRGPKGIWTLEDEAKKKKRKKARPPDLASISGASFETVRPTFTHDALVALERAGSLDFLATQNVDGLHRRSGFPRNKLGVLHGCVFTEKCETCGTEAFHDVDLGGVSFQPTGNACGTCGGVMRDTVLDWDDGLPPAEWGPAERAFGAADVCLALGTSLRIIPAADMPALADRFVIVNLQETPHDGAAALVVRARVDAVMERLCAALGVAELDTPTKDVFAKLDHDRSGEVHYHEFLAATLEAHELLNEEVLQDTFDRMDHDDSGVISRENLRSLLGSRASDELVETLMQDGDLKRNDHVDYEEFSRVMRSGASGSVDSLEDVAPMF